MDAAPAPLVKDKKLFIHQRKYSWGKLGLGIDAPIQELEAKYAKALLTGTQASHVAAKLSGHRVVLDDVRAPETFLRAIPPAESAFDVAMDDWGGALAHRTFELTCTLHLGAEGRAAFVERFDYELTPTIATRAVSAIGAVAGAGRAVGKVAPRRWSESPT